MERRKTPGIVLSKARSKSASRETTPRRRPRSTSRKSRSTSRSRSRRSRSTSRMSRSRTRNSSRGRGTKLSRGLTKRMATSSRRSNNELKYIPLKRVQVFMKKITGPTLKIARTGAFGLSYLIEQVAQDLLKSAVEITDHHNTETIMPRHIVEGIKADRDYRTGFEKAIKDPKLKKQLVVLNTKINRGNDDAMEIDSDNSARSRPRRRAVKSAIKNDENNDGSGRSRSKRKSPNKKSNSARRTNKKGEEGISTEPSSPARRRKISIDSDESADSDFVENAHKEDEHEEDMESNEPVDHQAEEDE